MSSHHGISTLHDTLFGWTKQALVALGLALGVGSFAGVAEAGEGHVKIKNCTDHRISVTVWNRNDNDKIFSSDDGNIKKDDTHKFKCHTKKCQVGVSKAAPGVSSKDQTIFDRNVRGDVRIEREDNAYVMKDGHTCDH